MADKAENENQGAPASGERRAALRSDESGGGSTRVRESGFPMRKASTLPDVSAYSRLDRVTSGRTASAGRNSGETEPDERADSDNIDTGSEKSAASETPRAAEPPAVNDTSVTPTLSDSSTPTGHIETTPTDSVERQGAEHEGDVQPGHEHEGDVQHGDEHGGDDAEDRITADPSSPATEQISATPVAATPDGSTAAGSTAARSTAAGSTAARSTGAGSTGARSTGAGSTGARSTATRSTATRSTADGSTADGSTAARSTAGGSTAARSTATRSGREGTDDDAAPDTSALTIRPPEEDVSRRASQRDEAAAAKPLLPRILQVVVAVFFPIILLAAAVRAVTTPLFLWIEYNRPGFPADSYGFSTEDRMTYGSYAMDYILNWAPARYLGDLVNTDGDQLFLDSEVGHMADVKGVLSTGFVVATVLAILAIAACIYLARRYPGGIRRALFAGAVATLVLAIVLAVAGILAWETFFTQVHALFFADGTWTFRLDDTLIRLFPAQFWIDAAASVGAIVLIGAALTLLLSWPTKARREKSADAYAARRANSGI